MLKQYLLVLLAAGVILISAPFVAAQDSSSNDQQSPPAQSWSRTSRHARRRSTHPGIDQTTEPHG